jgi:hypothetical protein
LAPLILSPHKKVGCARKPPNRACENSRKKRIKTAKTPLMEGIAMNGLKTGVYLLILKANSGGSSEVRFPHITIQDGEVHHYRINFSARGLSSKCCGPG